MNRKDVIEIINDELAYCEVKTNDSLRPDMVENFTLAHGLNTIQYHVDIARNKWYTGSEENDYYESMEFIRKIAAVCVKLGEKYGMPERKFEEIIQDPE